MKTLWVSLLLAGTSFAAGPLSFGIRGGIPLTDFFENVNNGNFILTSTTHRYIIGPTAELKLPGGFGVEVDALYRRLNYNSSFNLVDVFTNNRTTGNAWEFPILAKYRFPTPLVRPYVDAGLAFDTVTGVKQTVVSTILPNRQTTSSTSNPAELSNSTTKGFVIGFGVDIKAIVLHVSPEFRYTRWGSAHFKVPNGSSLSNQNQAEFLVGFTF
jgi:opacity protein-like surface antigen